MYRLARRLVALATAYVVALNTLLPVLAAILPPTTIGEIGVAVICSAGAGGSVPQSGVPASGVPARDAPEKPLPLCPGGAACAMSGCAASALPDPGPTGAGAALVPIGRIGRGHDGGPAPTPWPGGSKLARGPPVA
ncbi:MAG TPA: hypothetical protein VG291_20430 [Xanthobacteraceae bacterium]|nr:hypothetical protein [Xanthobacteraceae bacterium]